MKTRNGFVSNSSSSSFIVAFDKVPTTIEEMKVLLFGEDVEHWAGEYSDTGYSTESVVKYLMDHEDQFGSEVNNLAEEIARGGFEGKPDFWDDNDDEKAEYGSEAWRAKWEEEDLVRTEAAARLAAVFLAQNEDAELRVWEIHDNGGGMGACMEHGNLFRKLPHIRINHH